MNGNFLFYCLEIWLLLWEKVLTKRSINLLGKWVIRRITPLVGFEIVDFSFGATISKPSWSSGQSHVTIICQSHGWIMSTFRWSDIIVEVFAVVTKSSNTNWNIYRSTYRKHLFCQDQSKHNKTFSSGKLNLLHDPYVKANVRSGWRSVSHPTILTNLNFFFWKSVWYC